jgi:hypothetical protein
MASLASPVSLQERLESSLKYPGEAIKAVRKCTQI